MKTISLKLYGNPGRAGANFSFTSQSITLRDCLAADERADFTAECTVNLANKNQIIHHAIAHIMSEVVSYVIKKSEINLILHYCKIIKFQ